MTTLETQWEEAMFELAVPFDGIEESYDATPSENSDRADMMMATRTLLPRRSGEPRFAPRQYFYPASKTGVVPSRHFVM